MTEKRWFAIAEAGEFKGVNVSILMNEKREVDVWFRQGALRFHMPTVGISDLQRAIESAKAGCVSLSCYCAFFGVQTRIDFYCRGMSVSIDEDSGLGFLEAIEKAVNELEARYAEAF